MFHVKHTPTRKAGKHTRLPAFITMDGSKYEDHKDQTEKLQKL